MTEAKIQAQILKTLREAGAYTFKTIVSSAGGVPDVIACYRGMFIAIEVKSVKGKASELQKVNLEWIRQAGGIAIVARSADEVRKLLTELPINRISETS